MDFIGKNAAFNIPILGKGYVGIVIKAYIKNKVVAVKIRRVDADRKELKHEAKMLLLANSVQVGPKFYDASKNCLVMEFINGNFLPFWLNLYYNKRIVKKVLKEIIAQCYRLDKLGVDHGELSKAPKHIIININLQPFLIDFETASIKRVVSNVTSICQFLFLGYGEVGKKVFKIIGIRERDKIINALRKYKSEKSNSNFLGIIQTCLS